MVSRTVSLRRVEVGEVDQLAGLHLFTRVVVGDVVVGGQPAVVEVVEAVQTRVVVVLVRRARPAGARGILARSCG